MIATAITTASTPSPPYPFQRRSSSSGHPHRLADMPTLAELEQWFEEQIPAHLSDIPTRVHDTLQAYTAQLIEHLHDLTPTIAQIESSIPSIPAFGKNNAGSNMSRSATVVTPAAPLHLSLYHSIASHIDTLTGGRRRSSIVMGIALVGLASTMTYRSFHPTESSRRSRSALTTLPRVRNGARYDAVIVLGADTPLGHVLCHAFAAQGFIVMASVVDSQSKQSFDALVPPSMRGYIKTIVLPHTNIQAEHIAQFVQSISSVRQMRWPLTAAGDPYARPGSEINILAVLNALSYQASYDESKAEPQATGGQSSVSPFDLKRLADDCQRRAIVPLAIASALLPILTHRGAGAHSDTTQAVILSLQHSDTEQGVADQALSAGMNALSSDAASRNAGQQAKAVAVVSLQSHAASTFGTIASHWPTAFGGSYLSIPLRRTPTWMPAILGSSRPSASSPLDERQAPAADRMEPRDHKDGRLNQASQSRNARQIEYRTVSSAAIQLVLKAATTHTGLLRSTYFVHLAQSQSDKKTAFFRTGSVTEMLSAVSRHVVAAGSSLRNLFSSLPLLRLAISPRSTSYSGTRNFANNRPAFGPGPGPASNTHSRSCIRAKSSSSSATSADHHSRQQGRPRSTGSARSSGSESGVPRESVAPGSTPVSAPASSAHDMSSSGLLSSVPSSAFGDLSEEEHYGDSDFAEGVESPIVGGRPGSTVGSESFQTPSSESWQHGVAVSLPTERSLDTNDEYDDSGTALGSRNNSTGNAATSDDVDTPHASHLHHDGPHRQVSALSDYGSRPTSASADGAVGATGSGLSNQYASGSTFTPTSGLQSPLGQSWVALGHSSTQAGGSAGNVADTAERS